MPINTFCMQGMPKCRTNLHFRFDVISCGILICNRLFVCRAEFLRCLCWLCLAEQFCLLRLKTNIRFIDFQQNSTTIVGSIILRSDLIILHATCVQQLGITNIHGLFFSFPSKWGYLVNRLSRKASRNKQPRLASSNTWQGNPT